MSRNMIANRYEVFQHIGQGGMADVFLAMDTILNRQVAVKILRSELSTDAVSVLRFEREAQAATALTHPNIVDIYDVGDYKGHHFIVMEYVQGRTLKQVVQARGALLKEEAVDIMKQLCSAIAEAHKRGLSTVISSPRTSSSRQTEPSKCSTSALPLPKAACS